MIEKLKLLVRSICIIIAYFVLSSFLEEIFVFSKYSGLISGLLTLFILIFYFRIDIKNDLKNLKKVNKKKLITYTILFFASYITVVIINSTLTIYLGNTATNEQLIESAILTNPLIYFFEVVFIAPFTEELLCRLNFRKLLKSKWTFAIFTGIFFASLHLVVATSIIEILFIIPYFIMGFYLGYIYADSNSIFTSTFYHLLNNLIAFIILIIGS